METKWWLCITFLSCRARSWDFQTLFNFCSICSRCESDRWITKGRNVQWFLKVSKRWQMALNQFLRGAKQKEKENKEPALHYQGTDVKQSHNGRAGCACEASKHAGRCRDGEDKEGNLGTQCALEITACCPFPSCPVLSCQSPASCSQLLILLIQKL